MSDLKQIAEEAGFTPTPNGAAWYANDSDLQRFATAVQQKAREQALVECARICAIHSQYPIETDFDRGYDKARKDCATAIRNLKG